MSWDRGYYTGQTYCSTVMPEMAPAWMDFAALVKGHRPPRQQVGEPFRYLELGCGTGLGLCLQAALHPEGTFLGVDFMPAHIAQARWLARRLRLANVRFLEADLVDLSQSPDALEGAFTYVTAHGLYTWVEPLVQQALVMLTERVLEPGGLFYCSYNTMPGWLGRTAYQMLASLEQKRRGGLTPEMALGAARGQLSALLREPTIPFSVTHPLLKDQLPQPGGSIDTAYLAGEYLTDAWRPLYVSEVHSRFSLHKLDHVATATLSQLHQGFLNPGVASLVQEEKDPLIREALFDLALNQSFRRDLFTKGRQPLPQSLWREMLAAVPLQRLTLEVCDSYSFTTNFGRLELEVARVHALESALADEPRAFGDLALLWEGGIDDLLPTILILIENRRIGFARGQAAASSSVAVEQNRILREHTQEGYAVGYQMLPQVAASVETPLLEVLILEALLQGLDDDAVASCVLIALAAEGRVIHDAAGIPLDDYSDQYRELAHAIMQIRSTRLPLLQEAGALGPPSGERG